MSLGMRLIVMNGKTLMFSPDAHFEIEIGSNIKGRRGKYEVWDVFFPGDVLTPFHKFSTLPLREGGKKRLLMVQSNGASSVLRRIAA